MRDYAYLILMSQTSTRGPIVGHIAQNLDAQQVFINTFEKIINRRVDTPEDIQRFQKTLQYARSKVDYVIGESVCMLPSDMNLRIGKIKNYTNKILVSSPSFKIGTNLRSISMVKGINQMSSQKNEPDVKSNKEHKQDVKIDLDGEKNKPDVKPKKRNHFFNLISFIDTKTLQFIIKATCKRNKKK